MKYLSEILGRNLKPTRLNFATALIIEPKLTLSDDQLVTTPNDVAHVRAHLPFKMWVANFADKRVRLQKGQVMAYAFSHLAYAAETEVTIAEVLNITIEVQ